MKIVYFLIWFIFLISCQNNPNSIEVNLPYAIEGWEADINGNLIRKYDYSEYNKYGDRVKYIKYFEVVDDICSKLDYDYKDDRKIKFIHKDCDGTFNRMEIYSYDKLGRLIKETGYRDIDQTEISYLNIFEYVDSTNKIGISKKYFRNPPILDSYVVNEYDDELIKQKTSYLSDSTLYFTQTFEYDSKGNKTFDSIYYNPDAYDGFDNPKYFKYSADNILESDCTIINEGFILHKYIYSIIE